ncbi:MAG: DUF423 domain-containing protein [Campylobacterota bacterium]|nr:DUF423 domain-containing protein [Campylobacterota bacterium]
MQANSTSVRFIRLGALMMALAVALGAFGAHGLKKIVEPQMLVVYQTGVQYHFYHALGLIFIGLIANVQTDDKKLQLSGWLMFAGIVIFSGSLYIMTLTGIKEMGAITPIGGVLFIVSWILLVRSFSTKK